jgi:NADH-quinone oxidoreductase subunit N
MLAYSGIAHTGYLLLALLVIPADHGGLATASVESHTKAVLFYLLSYGVMTLGAFGVISMVREDGRALETIDDFKGLAKEHPGVALCMAIFMFSLAGLPPTGGFFAKFVIFRSAMEQAAYKPEIIIAAVIGVLTSVASLYYYLRVVIAMYMPEQGEEESATAKCKYEWNSSLLIYAAGIVTLVVGLVPSKFWF